MCGRHRVTRVSAWLVVTMIACGPTPTSGTAHPTGLEPISGDSQTGKAGIELNHPLVVQAVDGEGRPVSGVAVEWRAQSERGAFRPSPYGETDAANQAETISLADGTARTYFMPLAYEETVVTAAFVDYPTIPSVEFVVDVGALVIRIEDNWGWSHCQTLCLFPPGPEAVVPVGGVVEWWNRSLLGDIRIQSTSTPELGTAIDVIVPSGETWGANLDAEGTWSYQILGPLHLPASSGRVRVYVSGRER